MLCGLTHLPVNHAPLSSATPLPPAARCQNGRKSAADIEREQEALLAKKYGGLLKRKQPLMPKVRRCRRRQQQQQQREAHLSAGARLDRPISCARWPATCLYARSAGLARLHSAPPPGAQVL